MDAKIQNTEILAAGRFLRLEEIEFCDRRGKLRRWEAVNRTGSNGAALIVARIVPDDELILIRQFRPPAGKIMLEFPAGLIDPGEDAAAAAVRELKEETGYEGRVLRVSAPGLSSAGLSGEAVTTVEMQIDGERYRSRTPEAKPEENEEIEVLTVPCAELEQFVAGQLKQGVGVDAKLQAFLLGLEWTKRISG